jgi:hypothetical protein
MARPYFSSKVAFDLVTFFNCGKIHKTENLSLWPMPIIQLLRRLEAGGLQVRGQSELPCLKNKTK